MRRTPSPCDARDPGDSLVFITTAVVVVLALHGLVTNWVLTVIVVIVLVDSAFSVFRHTVAWRARRRAKAHDHLLCPDCAYDLRTLYANGTCPECGRLYQHEAVRATWLDAQRRLKRR